MIRVTPVFFGLCASKGIRSLAGSSNARFSSSLSLADKVDSHWKNMKKTESLTYKAISLIYGERKYCDLTDNEKKMVDHYQEQKLEEDDIILPNTRAALEQAEVEEIFKKMARNKT